MTADLTFLLEQNLCGVLLLAAFPKQSSDPHEWTGALMELSGQPGDGCI